MAEEQSFTYYIKRNSLQPMNYYDDPSLGSQLFIPKPSRPSLEPGQDINLPLSRNHTCNSPKSMDLSEEQSKKRWVRPSDLPLFPFPSFVPQFDKTENFSQLWINPTHLPTENHIFDIGEIIKQKNQLDSQETPVLFRPDSRPNEISQKNTRNTIQTVFLGAPHTHHQNDKIDIKINNKPLNIPADHEFKPDNLNTNKNLEGVILKIFYREKIYEDDLNLSNKDFGILSAILQRKFMKAVDLEALKDSKTKLVNVVENLINFSSNKRSEECHKFILSKAFKHLRKNFKTSTNNELEGMQEFYEYYFRAAANRLGLQISAFYFPSKSKSIKNCNSFNGDYFSKLFSSPLFVKDLKEYMRNVLISEHKNEIKKKVSNMVLKWDNVFQNKNYNEEKALAVIRNEIIKNKKFKLSWTFSELSEAIFRVNELIDSFVDTEKALK